MQQPIVSHTKRIYTGPLIPHTSMVWWYRELHERVDSAADLIGEHTCFLDLFVMDHALRCAGGLLRNVTIFMDDEEIAARGGKANNMFSAREDLLIRVGMDFVYHDVARPIDTVPPFVAHRERLPFVHAVYIMLTESFIRATNRYMDMVELSTMLRCNDSDDIKDMNALSQAEALAHGIELRMRAVEATLYGTVQQVRWHMMHAEKMRDRVILAFRRLAMQIAKQFGRSEQQIWDNFQHGSVGLVRAANYFDRTRERAFSGLARNWIRANVLLHLKTEANICRLPNAIWQAHKEIDDKIHELGADDMQAVSLAVGYTIAEIEEIQQMVQLNRPVSLENPVSEDGSVITTQRDNIRDLSESQEDVLVRAVDEDLAPYMRSLTVEESVIVCCLFGAYEQIPDTDIAPEDIQAEYFRQLAASVRMIIG